MRCSKTVVTSSVLALVASLSFGAGTASASDPAPTVFVMRIVEDTPLPIAGRRVSFAAVLDSAGPSVVGRPVQLWVRSAGQTDFVLAATVATDEEGEADARVVLEHNAVVHWVFAGDAGFAASRTSDVSQPVATRVDARGNDDTLQVGQRLVVRGTTFPAKPGHTVTLFAGTAPVIPLLRTKPPTRLATAVVRGDGSYRLVTRFGRTGHRRLFVRVSRGDGNARGFSPYLHVRVG